MAKNDAVDVTRVQIDMPSLWQEAMEWAGDQLESATNVETVKRALRMQETLLYYHHIDQGFDPLPQSRILSPHTAGSPVLSQSQDANTQLPMSWAAWMEQRKAEGAWKADEDDANRVQFDLGPKHHGLLMRLKDQLSLKSKRDTVLTCLQSLVATIEQREMGVLPRVQVSPEAVHQLVVI